MKSVAAAALLWAGIVLADERATVCFNYGCVARQEVSFSETRLTELGRRLGLADTPVAERAILSLVVGQLYLWAGEQSPIHADRPGDFLDDGVHGMMDCIDHAETTSGFLRMMEGRRMMRFHAVEPIQRRVRWLVTQHFSAVIRETNGEAPDAGARFVVDSWFGEHGDPAVVLPLEDWLDGEGPNVS
ncbi:hypothetical protein [Zoogloea sp.]|jgi:hypothetical protein|uniref:hypothetical protein n=1 Tax=Zoogloea sp. TaxID=49181 RepID=UPI0011D77F00|nr:hypothetical protein [Zoogloea sp.]TXG93003.1 MAG: hypothetical protein E6R15_10495 [Zoogloea sp.]HOY01963.1 hypothetical protein [Zoogloea sp.]HPI60218.1 hypothetical protein [Zoogloea sp.]